MDILNALFETVVDRRENPQEGSYTCYLFEKGLDKILKKCGEECSEVIIAAKNGEKQETVMEISDLLSAMKVTVAEITDMLEKANKIADMKSRAHYYYKEIVPAMNRLRESADKLEMIVDKEYWPFPSYGDLIFEV